MRKRKLSPPPAPLALQIHPLTLDRWRDLERLFGERGACGGCWCMYWKLKSAVFKEQRGPGNKAALREGVAAGEVPGLIAYSGNEPVGWCALAAREEYPRLERSRILQCIDDRPVWSVVCFFVARPYRGRGVASGLLRAAVGYAGQQGARIVEGYPVDPSKGRYPDAFAYTGLVSSFRAAGFEEVARRSAHRPIMRYDLNKQAGRARVSVKAPRR
jgi:GNAT superfamily N-acetyltransferase